MGCQPALPDPSTLLPAAGISTGAATATPAPIATPVEPTPASTPPVDEQVEAAENPEAGNMTLTLWTIERLSPRAEGETGEMMAKGLEVFEETYPHLKIEVILKKPYGRGGVFDFLRTSKDVAPTVLPDVIFIDIAELPQAWRGGLIQPLDGALDADVVDDLLPAARNVATFDGQLVGVPFELDFNHLVYNTNKMSAAPLRWTDVLSTGVPYAFPAKSQSGQVNDAPLTQYLALGARLQDAEGAPMIDEPALRQLLEFYAAAVDAGVVDASLLEAGLADELWPAYLNAEVGLAHVSVHRYLADRSLLKSSLASSIPTRDGVPVNIGRGWALAVVTTDPQRQEEVLRFIEWLVAPDRLATWNQQTGYIPTRTRALQIVAADDPYWEFVAEQLTFVRPRPFFSGYDLLARILHQAVASVLSGEATPDEAIATAVGALNP